LASNCAYKLRTSCTEKTREGTVVKEKNKKQITPAKKRNGIGISRLIVKLGEPNINFSFGTTNIKMLKLSM
jgi:hypothetical protein